MGDGAAITYLCSPSVRSVTPSDGNGDTRELPFYTHELGGVSQPRPWVASLGVRAISAVDSQGLLEDDESSPKKRLRCGGALATPERRCSLCLASVFFALVAAYLLVTTISEEAKAEQEEDMSASAFESLKGEVPGESSFVIHLGGFCFGRSLGPSNERVGASRLTVFKEPADSWLPNGTLHLMAYDDEDKHWGVTQRNWARSSLVEKVRWASLVQELHFRGAPVRVKGLYHDAFYTERYIRHWHFVLVGDGLDPSFKMRYELIGYKAMSKFGPEAMLPSRCPDEPVWNKVKDYTLKFASWL